MSCTTFMLTFLLMSRDLKIVDFTGFIDKSDFHFNGNVHDYGFWMKDTLERGCKTGHQLNR
jgi:hypothetical protein